MHSLDELIEKYEFLHKDALEEYELANENDDASAIVLEDIQDEIVLYRDTLSFLHVLKNRQFPAAQQAAPGTSKNK